MKHLNTFTISQLIGNMSHTILYKKLLTPECRNKVHLNIWTHILQNTRIQINVKL